MYFSNSKSHLAAHGDEQRVPKLETQTEAITHVRTDLASCRCAICDDGLNCTVHQCDLELHWPLLDQTLNQTHGKEMEM